MLLAAIGKENVGNYLGEFQNVVIFRDFLEI